jgi:hypothetical protein
MYIKDGIKSEPIDVQDQKKPSTVAVVASKTRSNQTILSIKDILFCLFRFNTAIK